MTVNRAGTHTRRNDRINHTNIVHKSEREIKMRFIRCHEKSKEENTHTSEQVVSM